MVLASHPIHVCQLSPVVFQAEASSVLAATQAQSRRVISRLARALESPESFRLFIVYQKGIVVGAICFELCKLYICAAGNVTVAAARTLLADLSDEFGKDFLLLQGCDGPPGAVDSIAVAYKELCGCCARSRHPLETMILETSPRAAVGVPGVLRPVPPQSKLLPILALWFQQFEKDTDNESYSLQGQQQVTCHLSEAASRQDLYTWEVKEKPVAMAILGRTQPKQLICVYTPPHQRGRGYGHAVTAAACAERWRVTEGKEPITLSAAHKFGAARVYERVGFRSEGWLHGVTFEDCCHDVASPSLEANLEGAPEKISWTTDVDAETDVETDAATSTETDMDTDVEADEVADAEADVEADLDVDCWDLETDPAKLFASSSAILTCP